MRIAQKLGFLLTLGLPSWCISAPNTPPVELKNGMVITGSVQVKAGIYHLQGPSAMDKPVILIQGNNITVDFNKAELLGNTPAAMPNEFGGMAILVRGNNITIRNARVHGYKIAVMATGCKNLQVEYCDLSYNYRQHLQSNWQREDVSDWMSYHHNENDEWMRYGAGIYLKDCDKAAIHNNTIHGGQCALMMMRCNNGMVYANDFTFNSAIGIGMYRSSRNNILSNKLDYNVRGYSYGFYNRGQDSAAILVFEQCNDNTFAYNSATHSGDGFFLWAGQTTMDDGSGGCNDNYIFKNDFSYAPTNGVEVTFSRNEISQNMIRGCDNGIWGGYSYNTLIEGNKILANKTAIAIEHGQDNIITGNEFDSNRTAIKLWARKQQPSDWGYAKKRDTRSRNYTIWFNTLSNNGTAMDITLTDSINSTGNEPANNKVVYKISGDVTHLDTSNRSGVVDYATKGRTISFPAGAKLQAELPKENTAGGISNIRMTEWGPYDYQYPLIYLENIDSNNLYHFNILGPAGNWKVKTSKGFSHISQSEGKFPVTLTAEKHGTDMQLNLEYSGPAFTDIFGQKQPAAKPYPFTFRDLQPDINWDVKWYSWDAAHDPNKDYAAFRKVYDNAPVKTETAKKIDYTWWGEIGKHLPADSFATVATGTVELEKGMYRLGVTADDLVKVFVDGKPVIDFWDASKYKYDEDAHHSVLLQLGGRHTIHIEQVENSGYATLIFYLKPL